MVRIIVLWPREADVEEPGILAIGGASSKDRKASGYRGFYPATTHRVDDFPSIKRPTREFLRSDFPAPFSYPEPFW